MAEWTKLTNKERQRYRVEAEEAEARAKADRRQETEALIAQRRIPAVSERLRKLGQSAKPQQPQS